jgi:hypothetical protein
MCALAVLSLLAPAPPALAAALFTPVPGTPVTTYSGSQVVRLSADGSRLFGLNPRSGGILNEFEVAPSGVLFPLASITDDVVSCGGYALAPSGARAYGSGAVVGVLAVAASGVMTRVQATAARSWCPGHGVEYVASPAGDVVYVNESVPGAPNRVTAWQVGADGLLGAASTFATGDVGASTSTFQPSPARRLGYAAGRLFAVNAASVSAFDVQIDGALLPAPGSPYAVPGGASPSLAVAPDAGAFFAATPDAIARYAATGGGFAPARSIPTTSAVAGLELDPSGRFLIAAFPAEGLLRAYDAATLLELAGSPQTFQGPTSVAFAASGTRLFVGSLAATGVFDFAPVPPDTTPPTVTFRPVPAFVNALPLSVSAIASDPDDHVVSAELLVDGALVAAPPVAEGGAIVAGVVFAGEGPHTITLSATDEHGNTGSASATVVYDATPPSLSVAAAPPLTTAGTYAFAGTASDANGVADLTVTAGGTVLHPALVDGAFSGEVPLDEGANAILFTATDAAGSRTSVQVLVQRDTRSPDLAVTSPADGSATGAASFAVAFTVSDDSAVTTTVTAAGVVQTFPGVGVFTATVIAPGEGLVPVLVSSQDAAGNPPAVRALAVLVDLSAPLLDVQVAGGGPLADEARFGPFPGDVLFYTLRVDDLDATAITLPDGGSASLPRGGGVLTNPVALAPGPNVLAFQATDEVGRTGTLSRAVVYDPTPPIGAIVAPSAGDAVRGVIELSVRASDAWTGVARVLLAVDGAPALEAVASADGETWTAELDTATLEDGPHALAATFVDGVGNSATDALSFVVDNAPPTVAPVPLPPYVAGTVTLEATAQDATSGVVRIALSVGGVEVKVCEGDGLGTCSTPFDTTSLLAGPFTVSATARDAAGNGAAAAQTTSIVDNTRPSKFLVSPVDGDVVRKELTVTTHVVDASFDQVECFVDGTSLGVSHDPDFTTTVSLAGRSDGALVVSCTALDLAGNVGTQAATVQVKRWREALQPSLLSLGSQGCGSSVIMLVAGPDVAMLLPAQALGLKLLVPGGAPVPVTRSVGWHGLLDGDGLLPVALEFDRCALTAAIRAGIASGLVDPKAPVPAKLFAGSREIGGDRIRVVR